MYERAGVAPAAETADVPVKEVVALRRSKSLPTISKLATGGTSVARAMVVLAMCGAAAAALPAAATARATVFNYKDLCTTTEQGTIYCFEYHAVFTQTNTPSGIESATAHGRASSSADYGNCSEASESHSNSHYLLVDGVPHESGYVTQGSFSNTCIAPGVACTFRGIYHFANGEVQFDRPEVECTEPAGG